MLVPGQLFESRPLSVCVPTLRLFLFFWMFQQPVVLYCLPWRQPQGACALYPHSTVSPLSLLSSFANPNLNELRQGFLCIALLAQEPCLDWVDPQGAARTVPTPPFCVLCVPHVFRGVRTPRGVCDLMSKAVLLQQDQRNRHISIWDRQTCQPRVSECTRTA